jgi:hypothetical protein
MFVPLFFDFTLKPVEKMKKLVIINMLMLVKSNMLGGILGLVLYAIGTHVEQWVAFGDEIVCEPTPPHPRDAHDGVRHKH